MFEHFACPCLESPPVEVAATGPVISEYNTPETSPAVLPIAQPLKSATAPPKPRAKLAFSYKLLKEIMTHWIKSLMLEFDYTKKKKNKSQG